MKLWTTPMFELMRMDAEVGAYQPDGGESGSLLHEGERSRSEPTNRYHEWRQAAQEVMRHG
jgi:hypothetical protein